MSKLQASRQKLQMIRLAAIAGSDKGLGREIDVLRGAAARITRARSGHLASSPLQCARRSGGRCGGREAIAHTVAQQVAEQVADQARRILAEIVADQTHGYRPARPVAS